MAATDPLVTSREAHRAWDELETDGINVGRGERLASVPGGSALTFYGLKRRGAVGTAAAAAGTLLIERGLTDTAACTAP